MTHMIDDPEIGVPADELRRSTRALTKAEALPASLQPSVELARQRSPLDQHLADAFAMIDPRGPFPPSDHKAITDELWGED